MSYRTLDPARIIETAGMLERRIGERFPESGLRKVAAELIALSHDTAARAKALEAPILWLRILLVALIVLGAAVFLFVGTILSFDRISTHAFDFVEGVEASINTLLLAALGLFSLVRLEERIKRRRVLEGLHGLRSLIHVIDMHQLTKDPSVLTGHFTPTRSSPARTMDGPALARYLDYCSEMLAITGKLAALYAQSVNDESVAEAVNDVENLSSNLSRKIWQKIMLIEEAELRGA